MDHSHIRNAATQADKARKDDPFYKLEHGEERRDKKAALVSNASRLAAIREMQAVRASDDYVLNKRLRRSLRASKKEDSALAAEQRSLGLHGGVKLLPAAEVDAQGAALALFEADGSKYESNWQAKRRRIMAEPIFPSGPPARPAAAAAPGGVALQAAHSAPVAGGRRPAGAGSNSAPARRPSNADRAARLSIRR